MTGAEPRGLTGTEPRSLPGGDALVVGFAVTGQAAAAALAEAGYRVRAIDDAVGDNLERAEAAAGRLGVDLYARPSEEILAKLAGHADLVVLSPGIPPGHPVFAHAPAERTISEIELGWTLLGEHAGALVAITGTNGKTTVTSLVTAMLTASGVPAVSAGNIGLPLVEIARAGSGRRDVIVVEVSSFQLAWTRSFRPDVSCWLNFAEDHLDWHPDLEDYASAKARIWRNQGPGDVMVVNAEDPAVVGAAEESLARRVTFGINEGDYRVRDGWLVAPDGAVVVEIAELPRTLPHDLANAAAAIAVAVAAGASLEGCRTALVAGIAMPHRIERVAEAEGVSWFDDSKATTPAAVVAALVGFDSVVLIAGGRNKGLDLGAIPRALGVEESSGSGPGLRRLRGVVAIGESAGEVERVFGGLTHVTQAVSMDEAVALAASLAQPGDAVVLSPGCASFDWYRSYGERGDDFARAVKARIPASGQNGRQS